MNLNLNRAGSAHQPKRDDEEEEGEGSSSGEGEEKRGKGGKRRKEEKRGKKEKKDDSNEDPEVNSLGKNSKPCIQLPAGINYIEFSTQHLGPKLGRNYKVCLLSHF